MKKHFFQLFRLSLAVAALLTANEASAQRWKYYRQEVGGGIVGSNFLGDLGGGEGIGTNYLGDTDIASTRMGGQLHYRYRLQERLYAKGTGSFFRVSGTDAEAGEAYRRARNLSFRSWIAEAAVTGEFYIFKESTGGSYRLRGARGNPLSGLSLYLFGGIGAFWFQPQAYDPGTEEWVNLKELSTSGQGLGIIQTPAGEVDPGDPYSNFSICLPYGVGIKYKITSQWSLGLEFGMRKTFTDWIDDVSGFYYDNSIIRSSKGDQAAYFADPGNADVREGGVGEIGVGQTDAGQQRGDPNHKDAYMIGVLSLNYKIRKIKTNRPKF